LVLDSTVNVLDYRLAPEHPFPAAVDDAVAAYRDVLEQQGPAERIALIGDSAGGGLVMATLIAARRIRLPQPAAAVALSPWADLRCQSDAYVRCGETDLFLDRAQLFESADLYLAGARATDPVASPALAAAADLQGIAPILVQVGSNEVLSDDARLLAERACAAGVDVELEVWEGLPHVWQAFGPSVPESAQAMRSVAAFVTGRWNASN
jgi:acetyl esterase/lipase